MHRNIFWVFFLGGTLVSLGAFGAWPSFFQSVTKRELSAVPTDSVLRVVQNFQKNVNKYMNRHIIPAHQRASYLYLQMASFFNRADQSLHGFAKYFREASKREWANADTLISYINKRGGYTEFRNVDAPVHNRWVDGHDALEEALTMERYLNEQLLLLHGKAADAKDAHLTDYLEEKYLQQKVSEIKELADQLAILDRMKASGDYSLGEFIFDEELQ